jgi:hypothetical protein
VSIGAVTTTAKFRDLPDLAPRAHSGDVGIKVLCYGDRVEIAGVAQGGGKDAPKGSHLVAIVLDYPVSTGAVLQTRPGQTARQIGDELAAMLSAGGVFEARTSEVGSVTVIDIRTEHVGEVLHNMRETAIKQSAPFSDATIAYVEAFGRKYQAEMRKAAGSQLHPTTVCQDAATAAAREGSMAAVHRLGSLSMFAPSLVGTEVAMAIGRLALMRRPG